MAQYTGGGGLPDMDYDQQLQQQSNFSNHQVDENLPLEYRDDYKFKNGAVYKGQWKGTVRHGRGT